jgi:uncharacterized protein (TIGR02145 family)
MKTKNKFGTIPVILMGLILALTTSCQKEEESTDKIVDKDGNVYTSVTIGTQVWMVENLKTTKLNDGTAIPIVTGISDWKNLTTKGYCWYNNDATTYKDTYGALYNGYAISTGKLCPTGWHVPTDAEWHTLILHLDVNAQDVADGGYESQIAGGKLKETGTLHWESPNTGNNESGFTALGAGSRSPSEGTFWSIKTTGYFWSSTEDTGNELWSRLIGNNSSVVLRGSYLKTSGGSVRCIKN